MTTIIIIFHLIIDGLLGLSILSNLNNSEFNLFTIIKAIALGMVFDTLLIAFLSYLGMSIYTGFIIFSLLAISLLIYSVRSRKLNLKLSKTFLENKISIWELGLMAILAEKFVWGIVNIYKLPIYFDDTFNHWSGRGKALLYEKNWSWETDSVYFLGKAFGHMEYPLFASIWRATNASFLGHENGITERIDGLIMWIFVSVTLIYWISEYTGKRWAGLAGASIVSMIPLEAWHITAGYSEIFIQAYLLLALWSIFHDKFMLGGIFTAAVIWSKNEGLIIFLPALLFCLFLKLYFQYEKTIKEKIKDCITYNLSWFIPIAPWLIFKLLNGVGFTIPSKQGLAYVDGSLFKMWKVLFDSSSSNILWISILIVYLLTLPFLFRKKDLISLYVTTLVIMSMMIFIFTCTGAYIFLENEMTIHRSLLQIAPPFIVYIACALVGSSKDAQLLKIK